jgi:hypothetical protein
VREQVRSFRLKMNQDPKPYLAMKQHGATAHEVYRKAFHDGFKKHECLALIMGVFDLELANAREIGHDIYYQQRGLSSTLPVLLFIVEDAFRIRDRGCVLVPGPSAEQGAPLVRIGDLVRLLKPDGESIVTEIRGLEMIRRRIRPEVITVPILLPSDITKEQVPKGTKVLLLRQSELANSSFRQTAEDCGSS